jgi:hypothetical protein
MNLHDDPQMKSLLESLPPDPDREHLEGTFLKRERQYHDVQDRAVALTARLDAIAESLPDASAKAQRELHAERRDLLIEWLALPADQTAGSRNYAKSLAGWMFSTFATIDRERHAAQQALSDTESAFREASWALDQFPEGTASPASDAAYSAYRELAGERQPYYSRIADLAQLELQVKEFASTAIPGKIINGRPTDASVRLFVERNAREAGYLTHA